MTSKTESITVMETVVDFVDEFGVECAVFITPWCPIHTTHKGAEIVLTDGPSYPSRAFSLDGPTLFALGRALYEAGYGYVPEPEICETCGQSVK